MTPLPVGALHPAAVILRRWRLMAWLWRAGFVGRLLARIVRASIQRRFGCYLSPSAVLEGSVFMPHPVGIVVGDGSQIGDGVELYQHVTIGRSLTDGAYPTIGRSAILYAGAVVIGNINIGNGAVIGANSVVRCSIPAESVAAGAPAKVLRVGRNAA